MELEADSTYWFRASSRAGYLITEPGLERVEGAYAMKSVRGAALVWPEGRTGQRLRTKSQPEARAHAQQGETQPMKRVRQCWASSSWWHRSHCWGSWPSPLCRRNRSAARRVRPSALP